MNYQTTSILPTNRSFSHSFIRGVCSFTLLFIVDAWQMQGDLNKIVKPYTSKRANFLFFGRRSCKIMNEELSRRGIDYRIGKLFPSPTKSVIALNLLCADYNEKGC